MKRSGSWNFSYGESRLGRGRQHLDDSGAAIVGDESAIEGDESTLIGASHFNEVRIIDLLMADRGGEKSGFCGGRCQPKTMMGSRDPFLKQVGRGAG